MYVTHTHTLSPRETKALVLLTNQCRLSDGLTLSFPQDGSSYWILEDDNKTVMAYFTACVIDEGLWECYAFTRPNCQGRGYFSQLLDQVCEYSRENGDPVLAFVTDERCPRALKILEHLSATYSHSEYMMSLPLPYEGERQKGSLALKYRREPGACGQEGWGEEVITVYGCFEDGIKPALKNSHNPTCTLGTGAVACRLVIQGGNIYLFSLETRPEYRRQGLATLFLNQLAQALEEIHCEAILLQVSGTNEAALNLYKKTGFRITETLSYYLY